MKIKLKKNYLTNSEVNLLVTKSLEEYNKEFDIEGYSFSPLSMYTNFYAMLFYLCIEGYEDAENVELYDKYYSMGIQDTLLHQVINAKKAFDIMESTARNYSSIEGILEKNLNKLTNMIAEKIPDEVNIKELADKVPEEWKKAFQNYNEIVGKGDK